MFDISLLTLLGSIIAGGVVGVLYPRQNNVSTLFVFAFCLIAYLSLGLFLSSYGIKDPRVKGDEIFVFKR